MDKIIYKAFDNTINTNGTFKLNIINRVNYNMSAIFMNGFSNLNKFVNRSNPCKDCEICQYIFNKTEFTIQGLDLKIDLQSKGNCNSTHLIYIIFCSLCKKFYVGETGKSLKFRIKQHLNHINKFIPFTRYHDKIVARHFNMRGHSLANFKVCIFKSDLFDTEVRKSKERDLVRFLNLISINCINLDISKKIDSLVFD